MARVQLLRVLDNINYRSSSTSEKHRHRLHANCVHGNVCHFYVLGLYDLGPGINILSAPACIHVCSGTRGADRGDFQNGVLARSGYRGTTSHE